jgi:hypothetical protein
VKAAAWSPVKTRSIGARSDGRSRTERTDGEPAHRLHVRDTIAASRRRSATGKDRSTATGSPDASAARSLGYGESTTVPASRRKPTKIGSVDSPKLSASSPTSRYPTRSENRRVRSSSRLNRRDYFRDGRSRGSPRRRFTRPVGRARSLERSTKSSPLPARIPTNSKSLTPR